MSSAKDKFNLKTVAGTGPIRLSLPGGDDLKEAFEQVGKLLVVFFSDSL